MKILTNSKAVNREISAMNPTRAKSRNISTENKVFIVLGVLVAISVLANIIINGIPSI